MATVIISLVLLAIVAGIITKMAKDKKSGKSSCDCGCISCPMSGECHKN